MLPQYKKFSLLVIGCLLLRIATNAQNTPALNQTAPSGTTTVITSPAAINTGGSLMNYIREYKPLLPVTNEASINYTASNVVKSTTYKDGFNRTMQVTTQNIAPGKYLVQPYDTRTQQDQYSYLPYAASSSTYFNPNMFADQRNYYKNRYPGEDSASYSVIKNISDANQRTTKAMAAGKSQVGQQRGTTVQQTTNTASEVRIWTISISGTVKPASSAYFNAGQLFGELTTSSSGGQSLTYKDKDGHVVYERKYLTDNGGNPVYGVTYYVYDELGQLRFILPPKAVELSTSGTVSQTVLDNLCFQYKYDNKGRKVEQKMPGKSLEEYVYDKKGRLVMYRNGSLVAQNKWLITFYDALDRPTVTSTIQTGATSITMNGYVNDAVSYPNTSFLYYIKNYNLMNTYPASYSGSDMLSYTYYDDYSVIDPDSSRWETYTSVLAFQPDLLSITGSETPRRSKRTHGMVTGTKVRILPSPNADPNKTGYWKETANFYDDKGRLIYGVSRDLKQDGTPIHGHYTGTQYNFANQPLLTKHIMTNTISVDEFITHTEWNRNYYDDALGRLTQSAHKIGDNSTWTIAALYAYDDLGRVQRKVLGNYGEVQDIGYNIRGQLAGINSLYAETGNKQGESRSFGESLKYDFGFTQPKYDGKLAGMVWRGGGTALSNAYGYTYDKSGRLTTADFRKQVPITGGGFGWLNNTTDYTVSNLTYDANGNILSMKQRGVKPGLGTVDMDVLTYTYESSGQSNRLQYVNDAGIADYGAGDFQNINTATDDYSYDVNGNLIRDLNKGISSVSYNYMDKPVRILKTNGGYIEYSYDATGSKVQQLIHDSAGVNTITDYIGNFIYKNNKLQFSLTGEGRSVYQADSSIFREEFFVKDHLGNVRSTIDVYTYPMIPYLASYEIASANLENMFFETIDEVRDDKPGSTFNEDLKSARLNGAESDRRTGTSLLLKVMAGDKVEMNVNNFYESYDHEQDQPLSAEDVVGSIIETLTGGEGGFEGGESHNTDLVDNMFSPTNFSAFDDIVQNTTNETKPRAYLNYILFDEHMNIIEGNSGSFQVNGDGDWQTIGTTAPMEIPVNGYLAVYINNASQITGCISCSDVFFDQLLIRFTKGNLKEENHYYPHGLPIVGLGSQAIGFKDNKYKYQSNEYNKELGLNWMNFHARQYDPQIGRFLSVDPLAQAEGQQLFSPYAAMSNTPEKMVDPNGTFAYASDISSSRADAEFTLDIMFGHGNYSIDNDGRISILNENAARNHFNSYMASHSGGAAASVIELIKQAGEGILHFHSSQNRHVLASFSNNALSDYGLWTGLSEIEINSSDPYGYLNVVQAAARDIGRNDYIRWKVDNFKKGLITTMAVGAAAPFAAAAAVEAGAGAWIFNNLLTNGGTLVKFNLAGGFADLAYQIGTKDASDINFASVGANATLGPLASSAVGYSLNLSANSLSGNDQILKNPLSTNGLMSIGVGTITNFAGGKIGDALGTPQIRLSNTALPNIFGPALNVGSNFGGNAANDAILNQIGH